MLCLQFYELARRQPCGVPLFCSLIVFRMSFSFSQDDFSRIGNVLNTSFSQDPDHAGTLIRYTLKHEEVGRALKLELLQGLHLPDEIVKRQPSNLISAYASNSFLQLHGCTGFIASQELGEVIFFARRAERVSGLVVEREAACSLYANVGEYLLSSDFTKLPPEMIMSSVALSLTESIFSDLT